MNLKLVGVLIFGLLLATASAVSTHEPSWEQQSDFSDETDFFYAGEKNEEAAKALARSLRKAGDGDWEVALKGDSLVVTDEEGQNWVIEPKAAIDGIDRLVLRRYFSGKNSRAADDKACLALINKLNSDQNVIQFSVDKDGDLVMLYSYDYRNTVNIGHLKDCLDVLQLAIRMTTRNNEDEMLKWFN